MEHRIFEGTWADVAKSAAALDSGTLVRLEVLEGRGKSQPIEFGMFRRALGDIPEELFHEAEFHLTERETI